MAESKLRVEIKVKSGADWWFRRWTRRLLREPPYVVPPGITLSGEQLSDFAAEHGRCEVRCRT